MKKNSILFLAMMGLFSLTWTGCTDEVDYTPAEAVQGQGVYFPKSVQTSYVLEDVKGEITLKVNRTNTSDSFEAPLNFTVNEGGDQLFKVPATVSFASGESESSVTVTFDNLVRGTNYEVSLSFPDATVYGNSAIKLNVIYPKAVEYQWNVVSENAVYIDNLFSMYKVKDFSFAAALGKSIVVEQAKGYRLFRFRSPYDNDYTQALFGEDLFPADFEYPYIVLDGETYKEHNLWYIKPTALGLQMVDGEGPKFDPEWNTFGSIAGNLSTGDGPIPPTSKDFPLGTYDKKSKCFNFGLTYHNLGGYGPFINESEFKLYLDPKLMEPDFLRDFNWNEVEGSTGQLTSEMANGATVFTSVYQAEEDPTFYMIPQLYSEQGNLFFHIKEDGTVVLPKKQKTGLTTYGNPIFMEGTPAKSSFDPKTQILKLGVTFYLSDEKGNKIADLKSGVETFMWGKTEVDLLTPGKSIDDYVGTYEVAAFEYGKGKAGKAPVTIVKIGDESLAVRGLSFTKVDDTAMLEIDSETGLLVLKSQQVTDCMPGMPMFLSLFNDKTEDVDLFDPTGDTMFGGFSEENVLSFVNHPANKIRWNGSMYLVVQDGEEVMLSGLYNSFDWAKKAVEQTKELAVSPAYRTFVKNANDSEFKVTLNKESRTLPVKKEYKAATKCTQKSMKL